MSIPSTGNVIQKKIATTRGCFCASPNYLHKFGTPKKPKDLINHRHIIHSMRNPAHILNFPNKESITIARYICVNDSQAMVKLAQEGLGIIKSHYPLVKGLLQHKILTELLTEYSEKDIPLYVAFPHRRYVSSKVRSFVDFTIKKLAVL